MQLSLPSDYSRHFLQQVAHQTIGGSGLNPSVEPSFKPFKINTLVCPAFSVTTFVVTGQIVGIITQTLVAAFFGAGADLDAFLIAATLPQFSIIVILNALGFVLIPAFVELSVGGNEDEAWVTASSIITLCLLVLTLIAAAGILFAEPLIRLIAPGLSSATIALASRMSVILWPTVILSGAISLLSSLYQANSRFTWPALVPTVGAVINLGLIILLARTSLGVESLAIALLLSLIVQTVLLVPIAGAKYRFRLDWTNPGFRRVIFLVWPLLVSSLIARLTPVVDRYLASNMVAGTISQLGYAYRIVTLLATFLSGGIATVIFPGMATSVAQGDIGGLRRSVSQGFRIMWLVIAPVVTIGVGLALPITRVVFQRGAFVISDAAAVSRLLQLYLFALVGMCLGNITGRTFYALKKTRLIAILGGVGALAYLAYAPALAHRWGAEGLAVACVVLFNFDLTVNVIVIRAITGNHGGWKAISSIVKITSAAVTGGFVSWVVSAQFVNVFMQFFVGGCSGVTIYVLALLGVRSGEFKSVIREVTLIFRTRFSGLRPRLKRQVGEG